MRIEDMVSIRDPAKLLKLKHKLERQEKSQKAAKGLKVTKPVFTKPS